MRARTGNRRKWGSGMSVFPEIAAYSSLFISGSAVMFSKYRGSHLFWHSYCLGDTNFFPLRERTLASSYGD